MIISGQCAEELVSINKNKYTPYISTRGTITVKLNKSLYGLIEAGKVWYDLITQLLVKSGFVANQYEPSEFNKGSTRNQTTVTIYVDDLLITSNQRIDAEQVIEILKSEFKNVTSTYCNR